MDALWRVSELADSDRIREDDTTAPGAGHVVSD